MRPLDPRLLRTVRSARPYVVLTAALGVAVAGLVVVQAVLLARVIAGVAMAGDSVADQRSSLLALGVVVVARACVAWAQERIGHRAATSVVAELRERVVARLTDPGTTDPRAPGTGDTGDAGDGPAAATTLATRGLDALDGYLTRYLPQLLLTATVTPGVLAVLWWHDAIAGWTVLVTLPLVPLFMALVGLSTQAAADRRLRTLQRLGAQVLDLLTGLETLRAFGRERGQAARIRNVGDAYRRATMRTLRSAFLSALVLETLTTLSVALVAVGVGLRLVHGDLSLETGLLVLILAPEVYLPLRMVGVQYHASVDGLAACAQAFEILERPVAARGTLPAPDLRRAVIHLEGLSVVHDGSSRATPAPVHAVLRPGEVTALVGESGAGKSSLVAALLGLVRPAAGHLTVRPLAGGRDREGAERVDVWDLDAASWWRQVAWVPQRPTLLPGTVEDNVRLTRPGATSDDLRSAAALTGLDTVVATLPDGWATFVGHGGTGLSAGQRQRVALTRALLSDAPLVVLDEPTSHLDAGSEAAVHAAIAALRDAGRTVLVVAHRPSLVAHADRVVRVHAGAAATVLVVAPAAAVPAHGRVVPEPAVAS
jgi:ATP-binding cassette subfamily C protein CydD